MNNNKNAADLLRNILRAAVDRRVNLVSFRPVCDLYEVKWQRGSRSLRPTIFEINRSAGETLLEYVFEKSGLVPVGPNQKSNEFEKPLLIDLDERFSTAWSAFAMNTNAGIHLTLDRIFPTPFESWQDLGFSTAQIALLRRNLEKPGGAVCFNNIYLEQTAHATAWLSLEELKRHRPAREVVHVAESFFHPDTDHTSFRVEVGKLDEIFKPRNTPPGTALVIEPVMKNYITVDLSEFFKIANEKRLIVLNCSYRDTQDFINQIKGLPAGELEKVRLLVHIGETAEECELHDKDEIAENFDFDRICCRICSDTGTSTVDYQVEMLEMTPEIIRALKSAGRGREFMTLAEKKGWFIK